MELIFAHVLWHIYKFLYLYHYKDFQNLVMFIFITHNPTSAWSDIVQTLALRACVYTYGYTGYILRQALGSIHNRTKHCQVYVTYNSGTCYISYQPEVKTLVFVLQLSAVCYRKFVKSIKTLFCKEGTPAPSIMNKND